MAPLPDYPIKHPSTTHPTMGEKVCSFPDLKDPSTQCNYKESEVMIGFHIEGNHLKTALAPRKKEGESQKKAKRIEVKPPKFMEGEMNGKFKKKKEEFQSCERQHFCWLEQEEDESINNFEMRVRSKVMNCEFRPVESATLAERRAKSRLKSYVT